MMDGTRAVSGALLICLSVFAPCSSALCAARDHCIAIAYTEERFRGVAWEIYVTGEYDLRWKIDQGSANPRAVFDLPNDTISSVRVRPGYKATLYEHAGLVGDSLTLEVDSASLGDTWSRRASSLTVYRIEDEAIVRAWQSALSSDGGGRAPGGDGLTGDELTQVLKNNDDELEGLMASGENVWYGRTTDEQRISMARYMLNLFDELGYDVSVWTASSFAQRMNDFYDWRKDLSIWRVACMALNVDPSRYEEAFAGMER